LTVSTSAITSTGGSGATGGGSSTGGATGGVISSGGTVAIGGTTATGGAAGGTKSTPATKSIGGEVGAGGRSDTGGSSGTGGNPTGGRLTGGGSKAIGGSITTGGSKATGGIFGTGGTSSAQLPPGVIGLFPLPGSQNTCVDPVLRVTFSGTPTLGSAGSIRVFNSSGTAVATIDMSVDQTTDTIGGRSFSILRPVYVDGNTVSIRLPSNGLAYGQTYYVNLSSGALSGPNGALSITGADTWRFTTVASPPSDLNAIAVATDNSGQFCTVQGALNAIPANNSTPRTITVNAGTYHEIVYFTRKDNITIQGTDRNGTMIAATNNNNVNPSTQGRALFGVDSVTGLQIKSMTIYNQTPQGGSQAEALRVQKCDQCVVRNATIKSLQDTLLWSGRVYADDCLIQGNVDYIWGTGVAYFNKCEIKTIGRTGVIVQSRNDAGAYGYVFVDSKLTADSAATNNMLARIDVSAYPGSHVAYINCQMTNIGAAGWTITGGTPSSSLRFWEYQSTDAAGNTLNVNQRASGSAQISASQAAQMRDPTVVLGGWQPPAG
jgi:pectin methylesterase-like acyl-CoA thioesterase